MPDITNGDLSGLDPATLQLLLANGGLGGSPYVGNGNPPPVTPPFLPGRNPAIPLPKIGAPPSIPNPAAAVQQQAPATDPDNSTPAPSLRDRILGGLPGVVNSAVSAASQPNQALGGPKDALRAFSGAQQAQQGQNLQQRALARQASLDDLNRRKTEADIANTTEDAQTKALERTARAAQLNAKAEPPDEHKGMQQLNGAWAHDNLPWLMPDENGQYWVDKTVANTITKPDAAGKLHVVPAGSTVVDDSGKLLYTAPDKPEKPDPVVKAKDAFQATISKLAAANELPAGAASNINQLTAAIKNSKTLSNQEKADALAFATTNNTPASTSSAGVARIELMYPQIPGLPPGGPTGQQANLTGEDYLKTLPTATANQVHQIAMGGLTMPPASGRGSNVALRNAVMQYDPQFSDQRAQIRKSFNTDKTIGANNTAVVHLDALGELAKAMDNGTFQPGNEIYNRVSTMLGAAAPTNYEGLRQAVAGEMDSALHGTSTIPGRDAIAATMPAKAAPGQMAGIVDTNLHTLGQKLNTYQERYHQQIPNDNVWSPILPSARAVFQKHGFDPTAGPTAGGGGTTGYVRTAVGQNNHTIGQKADGSWWDTQTGQPIK